MSRLRVVAVVLACGISAALAFMPMRVALDMTGLPARGLAAAAVSGTVWDATLVDAGLGAVALGDVRAALSPLPLLVGQRRLNLRAADEDGGTAIRGTIFTDAAGAGVADMDAALPIGVLAAPLPVAALSAGHLTLRFSGGSCVAASGRVSARLAGTMAGAEGVALPREVVGEARCDGGKLLLPLASQPGTEALDIRIGGDGRYRAELTVQAEDAAAAARLAQAGFVRAGGGYRLSVEGRF